MRLALDILKGKKKIKSKSVAWTVGCYLMTVSQNTRLNFTGANEGIE
jgi:hypothetical protein